MHIFYYLFFQMTDPILEEEGEKIIEKDSVERQTKKQKESIVKTIGTTIWLWAEELGNAIWGESKKTVTKDANQYQITPELEKNEDKLIKKRWVHED